MYPTWAAHFGFLQDTQAVRAGHSIHQGDPQADGTPPCQIHFSLQSWLQPSGADSLLPLLLSAPIPPPLVPKWIYHIVG